MSSSQSTNFKCSDCNKTYLQRSNLYAHQTVHFSKVPLHCKKCRKSFPDAFTLDLHLRKSSCRPQSTRRHVCTVCHRAYYRASTLALHRQVHFISRPFACTFCNAAFSTRRTLTRHLQAHNNWEIPRCQLCGLVFSQQSTLCTHKFLLRCIYPHNCNTCGQKFALKAQLQQHKKIHKTMLNGPFKCGLCDKEFSLRRTLIVHWRRHLAGPTFTCFLCSKAFYLKTRLATHLRSHVLTDAPPNGKEKKDEVNVDLTPFHSYSVKSSKTSDSGCSQDDRSLKAITTSKTSAVDAPLSASRIYRCIPSTAKNIYVDLGKRNTLALAQRQQVVSRVKNIVSNNSAKNTPANKEKTKKAPALTKKIQSTANPVFQCNVCKKRFADKTSLKGHQKRSHLCPSGQQAMAAANVPNSESLPKQTPSPFPYGNSSVKIIVACSRCGERNFKSLEELERHVCSKLKNKEHMCTICGKVFKFRCRLTTHILSHEQAKPCQVPYP